MKYLILSNIIWLFGCTNQYPDLKKIEWDANDLIQFASICEELANCMGYKWEVIHYSNQDNNPYGCNIGNEKINRNLYLSSQYTVEWYDEWQISLRNALTVCKMIKKKGEFSEQYIKEYENLWKEREKEYIESKERKKREWAQEQEKRKRLLKKIRQE
jgi:hypothetical protein